jgi:hypothetical protein
MQSYTNKKVWLCISSVGSIIITIIIILLGGINPLFASSSLHMPGMVGQHMGMQNMANQMPGMNMCTMMGKNMMFMQNMMQMAKQMMHHH